MSKRSPTTKDIGLLYQLFQSGQIALSAEFQRNSVWPTPAKAYLIDTILNDRPIPIFFLQRGTSAQTGRPSYVVIDGQQRLRAIFEYLDDRFALTQTDSKLPFFKKRFSGLTDDLKNRILNYDLVVQELSGYTERDIRDMFVRMNRYVVKLSPQELRHAKEEGAFKDFVEGIGNLPFWKTAGVFSALQIKRMKAVEFSAELAILLIEGPQDKKAAIDLYYGQYRQSFPEGSAVKGRLESYLNWAQSALSPLRNTRFRKSVDLYALVGALDLVSEQGRRLGTLKKSSAAVALHQLERQTKAKEPTGEASRYVVAASRQTDNIIPRRTRIEILATIIRTA
jgi:Protein of unknown function DUF262